MLQQYFLFIPDITWLISSLIYMELYIKQNTTIKFFLNTS
jgi:hypothetical protein